MFKARRECNCRPIPHKPGAVEIVALDGREEGNDEEWQEEEFESESDSHVPIRTPESKFDCSHTRCIHSAPFLRLSIVSGCRELLRDVRWRKATSAETCEDPQCIPHLTSRESSAVISLACVCI
jgi:hypothetical protein